jgi:hypothetical protein
MCSRAGLLVVADLALVALGSALDWLHPLPLMLHPIANGPLTHALLPSAILAGHPVHRWRPAAGDVACPRHPGGARQARLLPTPE